MFRTLSARVATLAALAAVSLPVSRARAEENAAVIYQQTLKGTVLVAIDGGRGSGWVVDAQRRLIVTNHHVAGDAKRITVYFPKFQSGELVTSFGSYVDGDEGVRAKLLLTDPGKDLAVIQVDRLPEGTAALKLAEKSPGPGERVHALGSPGASGALWVYSPGNVRAVYRARSMLQGGQRFDAWVVETSLPVNPGDSGGPEVNDKGELVAVTSHGNMEGRLMSRGIDVREVKAMLADVLAGQRGVRGKKATPKPADEDDDPVITPKKKAPPAGDEDEDAPAPKGKAAVKGLMAKAARLVQAKEFDEALAVYAQVLRLDPENVEALTARAWLFNDQGKHDAAARECAKALQVDDQCAPAYRERGYARLQKKQYESAVQDLTRAIRLNPKDAACYVYRAKAFQALGEDERADADLAKAKQLGYRAAAGE
jgi:S1-C subfamily serine protease